MQQCRRDVGNKIHGNIRKYMKIDNLHGLTCILNVWTCVFNGFCAFVVFGPIQKDARQKNMNFGGTFYQDLQTFYQDPIGDQNDGWSESPKCRSN